MLRHDSAALYRTIQRGARHMCLCQAEGKPPLIELHNPTDKGVTAMVRSPIHAPMFGGLAATVKIPAGDSVRLKINGKSFEP